MWHASEPLGFGHSQADRPTETRRAQARRILVTAVRRVVHVAHRRVLVGILGSWPAFLRRLRRPKNFCALSGSSDGVYGTDDDDDGVLTFREDAGGDDLTGDFFAFLDALFGSASDGIAGGDSGSRPLASAGPCLASVCSSIDVLRLDDMPLQRAVELAPSSFQRLADSIFPQRPSKPKKILGPSMSNPSNPSKP